MADFFNGVEAALDRTRDTGGFPAVEPFAARDHYVPRPDVPGHEFTRAGSLRGSSYGYSITCSCGQAFGWVVSAGATGVENRHRIEAAS